MLCAESADVAVISFIFKMSMNCPEFPTISLDFKIEGRQTYTVNCRELHRASLDLQEISHPENCRKTIYS